ncbi:hypothetical protein [Virgibacillus oceani]|uniref:Uncharacterized protein n=1 Tax=Virgibacillus oceani TaxID=1479511 RepID=A0A917HED2_9BACI|nr:hypothetical protein [Virgibacillus oceani]GGG76552.1 hypothetical protein GCM10011398_21900 [Virgibacillus oceani]
MNEQQLFDQIYEQKEQLKSLINDYWVTYSGPETWYFWYNIGNLVIPLVILYFLLDRKRLFEICFFGFSIHVMWANIDSILASGNYFVITHTLTHLLPVGVTVTAVLLPVCFMLIYQYCTNRGKNYYIYAIIAAILFAYGFGSIYKYNDMLVMSKGMNLTYLALIDIAVVLIAYWFTKLFIMIKDKTGRGD